MKKLIALLLGLLFALPLQGREPVGGVDLHRHHPAGQRHEVEDEALELHGVRLARPHRPPVGVDDEFVLLGAQGDAAIGAVELAAVRASNPWEVVVV